MDMQKIGRFLARLRKEKKMTQSELGEKIGVTNKTVSRWENGNYLPPVEMLQILADFFGVQINDVLNGERVPANEGESISKENTNCAQKKAAAQAKKLTVINWIAAICVALLYVAVSILTLKWQYTWIIWAVYCVFRILQHIVLRRLKVGKKSE